MARLPEPHGNIVVLQEKLYVPCKDFPDYNFIGRILGPRGMTAKQLEMESGCKIMIRGRGSMRDKVKEEEFRGKPNWEHLDEDLHVLLMVEDTENRAAIKMTRAIEDVKKLLQPAAEGEDNLKKLQLMELAIINGTYRELQRPPQQHHYQQQQQQQQQPQQQQQATTTATNVQDDGGETTEASLLTTRSYICPQTPGTATMVTTPILLTPRIPPFFPPPGSLGRPQVYNPHTHGSLFTSGVDQNGLYFHIDPNYVTVHHSPFLEYALSCGATGEGGGGRMAGKEGVGE
ncbi:hypothetical protein HELRODRAFT_117263 [Helobdella robusta]|uniref:K Homology domain-containing protein n=1 Tax=Helobdella robusta TaxID=6412 RepID=T1EGL5_HELRO|nr:hypothetical protein HELRODRAFT_117263 [Helobdella robusta]ESO03841.1 hypothetical protein HELRODRAFT_117263 [Helobdella robusta]